MSLDLEVILHSIGIEVLKERGDELIAKCPMHLARTGREDGHPSWSINSMTYVHHCFSCGYAGTLNMLYRDLMGEVPENLEWELSKQSVIASLDRPKEEAPTTGPRVSEWTLNNYVDVPDALLKRRYLLRESIDMFGVRWDKIQRSWVIPIRTPSGDLMGFQFRQVGLVLNHPVGMEKAKTLFGLHLFRSEPRITLVESPLDAVRFYNIGIPAVSSFGASISGDQIDLLARNYRSVISALDNDGAGNRAAHTLQHALRKRGCVVIPFDYSGLEVKDPGDVPSDALLLQAWNRSTSFNLIDG